MLRRIVVSSSLVVLLGLAYAWRVVSQSPTEPASSVQAPSEQAPIQQQASKSTPSSQPAQQAEYKQAKSMYQDQYLERQVQRVEALKEKYPVQSLAERLEYKQAQPEAEPPPLLDVAREELARLEAQAAFTNQRAEALKALHTLEVKTFAARFGAGVSRISRPDDYYLQPPRPQSMEFVQQPPLSAEATTGIATTALRDEPADSVGAPLAWLPTRTELRRTHYDGIAAFASPATFGWVQSIDHVVGFQPHAFIQPPVAPIDAAAVERAHKLAASAKKLQAEPRWQIARLELMSLHKHDVPRVYVSEQLPTMEELSHKNAKTRGLDEFETAAVEKIRGGDDVQTLSTLNRIQMLGAVRTSKMCLQCHDVPEGTLLGAFSYEFRRDPPATMEKSTAAVQ